MLPFSFDSFQIALTLSDLLFLASTIRNNWRDPYKILPSAACIARHSRIAGGLPETAATWLRPGKCYCCFRATRELDRVKAGGGGGAGRRAAQRSGSGGSQRQQQHRGPETPSPQQLREWYAGRQRGGGAGPCTYVLRTGDRTGEQCGGPHSTQRCFGRLTDAWRHQFPDATEIPRWGDLSRAGVAVFDLDYDAILPAMYALSTSDEGDCYLCVPPDPGIEAAALGAGETAALGASASAAPGAGESAPSGTASTQVFHTFTLDSGASRSFFRDRTTLTPLSRPVAVSLADPSGGPVWSWTPSPA
ncbi:unnamed protein product [Closterium sp. NIES-53]